MTALGAAPTVTQQRLVRTSARALARAGLVHAFGHCSLRLSREAFLVCAAEPMGLLTPDQDGTIVPVDGPLPEGVLGEVRIHQAIYRRRAEVGGVCRILPPNVLALSAVSATPRALTGYGAFFAPSPPLYDDARLIRDGDAADAVADALGRSAAVVLRGNGAVTAADTLPHAVGLAWYLEQSARTDLQVRASGSTVHGLSPAEAHARARWDGRIDQRLWCYLTRDDPEAANT